MNEAFEKIYRVHESGETDTAFWRTASYEEIRADKNLIAENSPHSNNADVLFRNEPARKAYAAYRKYAICEAEETSVLTIARMDAFINSIIASFSGNKESGQRSNNQDDINSMPRRSSRKGGKIPLESIRRFKSLLPIACTQLHREVYNKLTNIFQGSGNLLESECRCYPGKTEVERLGNNRRQLTKAFKYPRNGHYYIAIRNDCFAKYVCRWIGFVHDCFLLETSQLNVDFKLVGPDDNLNIIESDDEVPSPNFDDMNYNSAPIDGTFSEDEQSDVDEDINI